MAKKNQSVKNKSVKAGNRGLGSGLSKLLGDDLGEALEAVQLSSDGVSSDIGAAADIGAGVDITDKIGKVNSGGGGAYEAVMMVPVGRIYASSDQPRRDFSDVELDELAQSFRQTGVLQPILVMRQEAGKDGEYRIIAGERRWRAAQRAGLHELPVIVKELTEEQILQVALIENIQRQDLNIVEEALAYRRLVDNFGHRQEDIAEFIGKSRSYVANLLRLLSLSDDVLGYVRRGELGLGHVRGLVNRSDADALAERMVREGMNVRQAENLCRDGGASVVRKDSESLGEIETELAEIFGVGVSLRGRGSGYVASLRFSDVGGLNDFIRVWRSKKR